MTSSNVKESVNSNKKRDGRLKQTGMSVLRGRK